MKTKDPQKTVVLVRAQSLADAKRREDLLYVRFEEAMALGEDHPKYIAASNALWKAEN